MKKQTFTAKMTGYKATDANITCMGHKFELGQWYEVDEVELCKRGFHFCAHPSGVWSYYSDSTTRVFEIEAEHVLEVPIQAGADFKLVAKRIRLTKEITTGNAGNAGNDGLGNTGHRNTGHRNTGHWNTGDRNTGDRNTGDRNTGDRNKGDWNTGLGNTGNQNTGHWNTGLGNTGHRNTGDRNTGDQNTGDQNTGRRNTGDRNTGDRNTGDQNTGLGNTGNGNTGHWNTCNHSAGLFCQKEPKIISFDLQTNLTCEEFLTKYPEANKLGELLHLSDPIKFADFKNIPGITSAKLAELHEKHLAAKQKGGVRR